MSNTNSSIVLFHNDVEEGSRKPNLSGRVTLTTEMLNHLMANRNSSGAVELPIALWWYAGTDGKKSRYYGQVKELQQPAPAAAPAPPSVPTVSGTPTGGGDEISDLPF